MKVYEQVSNGINLKWCETCKQWTITYNTVTHQKGKDKTVNGAINCEIVPDPSMWYAPLEPITKWQDLTIAEQKRLN